MVDSRMTRIVCAFVVLIAACGDQNDPDTQQAGELSAGQATVYQSSSYAFNQPAPGLSDDHAALHADGDAAFEAQFVTPPAQINAGLGPLFNNNSCNSCHLRNGRGIPDLGDDGLRSQLLVRVSLPADQGEPGQPGGPVAVDGLGTQLQDHAVFGVDPEVDIDLDWRAQPGAYPDGQTYELRWPELRILKANGDSLGAQVMTSLRQPPPIVGLGLLEAVPAETIEDLADPEDADHDGISGRVNHVWSIERQQAVVGRFGHKANQPDLKQQVASAYHDDMGVTNGLLPADDGSTELDDATLQAATFYAESLGVPARRNVEDPRVQNGQKIFAQIGCDGCHMPTLESGPGDIAPMSRQTFHAYTDLLVHDMGDGLADMRPDFEANGREWRTAPLWGIGLTQTVLPGAGYLHDGRARTLQEAILWHGGEAQAARDRFHDQLDADARADLVAFLRSL